MIQISGFGTVLLFIVGGIGFLMITLLVGKLLRPNNPTTEKQTTYESGEEPSGTAWGQFNVRFYIVALIFLLFEAELIFLFPWATVFGDEQLIAESDGLWAQFSMIETFIFIGILLVGLAYVWSKGMLEWVRPKPKASDFKSRIPESAYKDFK
ncbi:NADH dehydrogenase subunit A [Ekhidna lutea]|uniref:NADH-quinone oxidoreductase subunit A n=1 Tax=Ekhidna lutea TaxID=447679 RepID=A0A239JA35_EKHLU|nr:NADH-quinone oxidoreductase subunit A [Ekhidna lutea]SNT01514.1 NADH dehydrogenase subunit A [Ekhidna lutea]